MAGLWIHTSNRLEELAGRLAESLRKPPAEPFAREVVVIQSGGMARWLTHEIARRLGIAMHIECPFPGEFVQRTLRAFFPEMTGGGDFAPDLLAWRIHGMLPSLEKAAPFAEVAHYLRADDGLMRFQLAEKIAETFEQYLVYRPEMLMEWERGAGRDDWQAILWRALAKDHAHPAPVCGQVAQRMAAVPTPDALPSRVSVFGVSSLPPVYLRVFFELSRHCDVRLFSLQPAREYFGHDLPPKQRAKLIARLAEKGVEVSADSLPEGNPLLASMGRLHRDFIELRMETDEACGHVAHESEHFAEPGADCILRVVQGDILDARARGDGEICKYTPAPGDRSIQFHACHSPLREVETLYDHLLAMFDGDSALRPRDVIVMTPDIEKYAPFIQAVFESPEAEARRIPFAIADRQPADGSVTVGAFLALLDLAGTRCTATEVFAFLERAPVRRHFGFSGDDLDTIRGWIAQSGIRWGIDGEHRASFGLPAMEENSWRGGMDRLLLGLAMDGGGRILFENILPLDDIEGSRAELLGRFVTAVESVFGLVAEVRAVRPLDAWADTMARLLDGFFSGEDAEEASDLQAIRSALDRLRRIAETMADPVPVEFRVMRHHLARVLDEAEQRGGFLTGRVTFCALKPNRSIPARVICLLGMDDGAFPRQARPAAFDRIAQHPQTGDRSVRDDDRATFLDAILSARDRLYISFVGRSIRDNGELPPAVPVSELLDYLDRACEFPGGGARKHFLAEHRLHAFSPVYFSWENALLFSYSESNAAASRSLSRPAGEAPPFLPAPLPAPDSGGFQVELRELAEFLVNPSRHFLRHRLGIRLEENDDAFGDTEPFTLDGLESYHLGEECVAQLLAGETMDARVFAARGILPPGEAGAAAFRELHGATAVFAKSVARHLSGDTRSEPEVVDLRIGEFSLTGKVEPVYGARLVRFRCAKLKTKDRIRAWIGHLALCARAEAPPDIRSLLIATDGAVGFSFVENAMATLETLLSIYARGMTQPLPFFPESARAFAMAKLTPSKKSRTPAEKKARDCWHGTDFRTGEKFDAAFALCFGDSDPLGAEFEQLACEIFGPMLEHEGEVE